MKSSKINRLAIKYYWSEDIVYSKFTFSYSKIVKVDTIMPGLKWLRKMKSIYLRS